MKLTKPMLWATFFQNILQVDAAANKIYVTGAAVGNGAAPARININDLYQQGGPQWDLYIQALAELQAVDESDELSYFKIMGIHGYPSEPYNGVGQVAGGNDNAGFCPHNTILFILWHRPYLALYEVSKRLLVKHRMRPHWLAVTCSHVSQQTLVSHALAISKRYSGKDAPSYRTAAESLRVPYWDWAHDPALPKAVTLEKVTVKSPTGQVTIRNPLHSYHYQKYPFTQKYMNGGILSTRNHTSRCPSSDAKDNITTVNANLQNYGSLKDQVYNVFTTVEAFQYMATDAYGKPSFESPHNSVHNSVGCSGGTMYDINWSGHDPCFMLHHANVDRLAALWQAIYPNSSIFDVSARQGAIYGTAAGTVDANSPLKPFYRAGGNMHTSKTVKNVAALGYTYPELQMTAAAGGGADELSAYVKAKVNALYSDGGATAGGRRAASRRGPGRRPSRSWSVAIQVDKSDIPLPATVDCHLGDSLVGRMALLAMPATGLTTSILKLDRLLPAHDVDLADREAVIKHLGEALTFTVQKGDGTSLDATSIPSLNVTVVDMDVTPRKSDREFPTFGPPNNHPWTVHRARH